MNKFNVLLSKLICMKPESAFKFKGQIKHLPAGDVSWEAPSNIALVKYWGKYKTQLPKNPSLSLTLSKCATRTKLTFSPKKKASEDMDFKVILEGSPAPSFRPDIQTFLHSA